MIRAELKTPVGDLFLIEREGAVVAIGFAEQEPSLRKRLQARFGGEEIRDGQPASLPALRAYLDGDLRALKKVRVDPHGTDFQRRVWAALQLIPPGETRSYADLARQLGSPRAVRAVGAANGQNPISVVIPCHRVIRSDGQLCGYAGGLPRKRWLLDHEGVRHDERGGSAASTPPPTGSPAAPGR
jgi:methylated-DNA-[protein]-cysteine S-methyltransferase